VSVIAVLMLVFGGIQSGAPTAKAPTGGADDTAALMEEQQELRTEFRARARAQAIFERTGEPAIEPVTHGFANGFDGEQRFGAGNDWEPAIGADPSSPYVYVMTTRFGSMLCSSCAHPSIVYRVSDDGGHTWGPTKYLCKGCNTWQYDPQVEVATDGTVFATWLSRGWSTWVSKSTDNGMTWSDPVDVKGPLGWTDHGFLTISPDGMDVYVAFNRRDSFVAASHDGGTTFADPVMTSPIAQRCCRYYFHYNGAVLPDDSVVISATAVSNNPYARGRIQYYALRSTDGGVTWEQIWIDTVEEQPDCYSYGCRHDHYAGMATVDADADGDLVFSYAGTRNAGRGQLIFVKYSTDGGMTWSTHQRLSPTWANNHRRTIASFPMVAGTGDGDFRLWWMDNRNGRFLWNVWYTESTDGGMTWAPEVRISDAITGAGYKHPGGFDADYGDYGEIAINNVGETVTATGQAFSYWGPGGTWMNVEV